MNAPATDMNAVKYRVDVDFILESYLFPGIGRKMAIFNDEDYEAYRRYRVPAEDAARALAEEFYFFAA